MVYLLTFIVCLAALVLVGYLVVGFVGNRNSNTAVNARSYAAQLKVEKRKVAVLSKALRNIANGTSGLPVLDAQNALDELEQLEIKELN